MYICMENVHISPVYKMSVSLSQCVQERSTTTLRALLAERKNDSKKLDLEEADSYGNTPLLNACYLGKREHAELLIDHGASLKAINYLGQNALTLATYSGSLEVVRLLLRFRSYSDFNKSSIFPALCVACLYEHTNLIEFFKCFPSSEEELKTAHGVSPAQISEWVKMQNRTEQKGTTAASGSAYRMR